MNSLYNQNNIKDEYWLNKTVSYIFLGKMWREEKKVLRTYKLNLTYYNKKSINNV